MSAIVLLTGKIVRDPQRKMSRNDKPYALATIRVMHGNESNLWQVLAFEPAAEELLSRREGEYVSLSGAMTAQIYTPEGKPPRVSLSVLTDKLISLKKPPPQPAKARGTNGGNGYRTQPARPIDTTDTSVPF